MTDRLDWISSPAGPLRGDVAVPGDKSISHRAIMLAALADGVSRIDGFLEGEDTRATAAMFRAMGVRVETPSAARRIVYGVGMRGLRAPDVALDCGNSGTAMRLAAGLLAGQRFNSVLTGDASLSERPMRRVIDPLAAMGARISARSGGLPPLRVEGEKMLRGATVRPPIASAQVKSAVLLGGLYAQGETEVWEVCPTRDHTERMLAAFGWPVEFEPGKARLTGGHALHATDVVVPADFSSAAFFLVAASLVPGSDLVLRGVGVNARRTGLLGVLRMMGADITLDNARECGAEPVADLRVRHAPLNGVEVPVDAVADLIDEFPALFVAAAGAHGVTTICGAAELRVKESDRIAVMSRGLRELGIAVEESADGAVIHGGKLKGGSVDSAGDHRCAMSFAIAGLAASEPVRIADCANVATSFPDFLVLAGRCGLPIEAVAGT